MNKCEFYISEGCTIQNFFTTVAAQITADVHRRYYRSFGKTLVICKDPVSLSKEIWKVPGFIPCATAGTPCYEEAPVVISDHWIKGYGIIVNTDLERSSYSPDELSCSILIDFTLKSVQDILASCRSRYRQLKNGGIQIESIRID